VGGQPKSEASSWSSAEVRRLWEEPTEAIPQNQREAAGILFLLGLLMVWTRLLHSLRFGVL